ncbi:hypothetical protein AAGS61_06755 [Lysinibacillus sp. KU-BSD001]|uniref:hypothetical protein n=1 Tax=Lysinibacillus sp. KU-BSD001 TaxID=3141328 RepID=UPI0036EB1FD8
MRYLKILCIALTFIFSIPYGTTVFADDDFEEHYEYDDGHGDREEHEDERYEDIGELIGWSTLVTIGVAALLFPTRKIMKSVITTFPQSKKLYVSFTKWLGKYHILIGIAALVLSICHGVLMYLHEGELESEGITGLGAVIIMVIAAIMGAVLFKNKKVKSLRTTHTILVTFGVVIVLFHIFLS